MTSASESTVFERILEWLRGDYPEGIPHGDWAPILGVLHRKLTDAEVNHFAHDLAELSIGDTATAEHEIRTMIRERLFEKASEEDVQRVAERLADATGALAPERESE